VVLETTLVHKLLPGVLKIANNAAEIKSGFAKTQLKNFLQVFSTRLF